MMKAFDNIFLEMCEIMAWHSTCFVENGERILPLSPIMYLLGLVNLNVGSCMLVLSKNRYVFFYFVMYITVAIEHR